MKKAFIFLFSKENFYKTCFLLIAFVIMCCLLIIAIKLSNPLEVDIGGDITVDFPSYSNLDVRLVR